MASAGVKVTVENIMQAAIAIPAKAAAGVAAPSWRTTSPNNRLRPSVQTATGQQFTAHQ
jgi:hypothetical protein